MRRCSEFRQLLAELKKEFPMHNFSELPQKKANAVGLTDDEIMIMRQQILQRFLTELIKLGLCEQGNSKIQRFLTGNNFVPFYQTSFKNKSKQQVPIVAVPYSSFADSKDLATITNSVIGTVVFNTESLRQSQQQPPTSMGIL